MSRRMPPQRTKIRDERPACIRKLPDEFTIRWTIDYEMFEYHPENRETTPQALKDREYELQQTGYYWEPGLPLLCRTLPNGKLQILEGHTRYTVSKQNGWPVWYVVNDQCKLHPRQISAKSRGWTLRDHMESRAQSGNANYVKLRDFVTVHKLPVSIAASMLGGRAASGGYVSQDVREGTFEVRDQETAKRVAALIDAVAVVFSPAKTSKCAAALHRLMWVGGFDPDWLVIQCQRNPSMLRECATVEQYLQMFEQVYYFRWHRKKGRPIALAKEAQEEFLERSGRL